MNTAIIGVGSNIDPEKNIRKAKAILAKELTVIAGSKFTRTKPVGLSRQPDFINGAFQVQTELDQGELNACLKSIETKLGRVRTSDKNAPRPIDLDIIVFNGSIVGKDFFRYPFVKAAVLELDPTIGDGHDDIDQEAIAEHFREILVKGLKVDIDDPNYRDTPQRVARSFAEIFSGLNHREEDMAKLFNACFPTEYRGIVAEKDIVVFSMCPHHFLPVRYSVSVGYIPSRCGIGLSKLARVIDLLARKPVLQETFTQEIVTQLNSHMNPLGVICVVKGQHYCMQMRGAKQKDVVTMTSSALGTFLTKPEMELKFYQLIWGSR
jgi:GTP cyclohydrolase IA